jgi:hypothetical protein
VDHVVLTMELFHSLPLIMFQPSIRTMHGCEHVIWRNASRKNST